MNTIRLPDGTELNAEKWLHWPLFSTAEWASTDGIDFDLFSYTVGQPVVQGPGIPRRNATEVDTNVVRGGVMNQDESAIVFALTYEIFGLSEGEEGSPPVVVAPVPEFTAGNLRRLQRDLVIALTVGADIIKPQHGVPFSWIHQSIGPESYTSATNPLHIATGGRATPKNQEQLGLPIYIGGFGEAFEPGNSIAYKLNLDSPLGVIQDLTQDVRLRWYFDCLRMRQA
jgi:hypothetical protein